MLETTPQTPVQESQKKTKVYFEGADGATKFVEITEKAPGMYELTGENLLSKEGPDVIAFHPNELDGDVSILEMNSRDDEYYNIFGHVSHFKYKNVEVDAADQENIVIKAPSLQEAIEAMKVSNPIGYDWKDR